jgi:hypothetical protein
MLQHNIKTLISNRIGLANYRGYEGRGALQHCR